MAADGDRRKPRPEGGIPAIGVRTTARRDPRLLHDVVELMPMSAKETLHEHAEPRRVSIVQRVKRLLAALEKAADEAFVGRGNGGPVLGHTLSVGWTTKKVTSL